MGNVTAKTSGEIASFMSPAKTNIKSLKVHFSPKQLGTGDPSPENVREIVGWDGVEVDGCGKNLFDISIMSERGLETTEDTFIGTAVQIRLGNTNKAIETPCFIPKNTPFTISCTAFCDGVNTSGGGWAIIFKTETGEYLDRPWYTKNNEITPTFHNGTLISEYNIVAFFFTYYNYGASNTWTVSNFQIELGSTATLYKPYQGNTISYQWKLPDEYQEVEYIESTGTQYIDTGVIGRPNIKVETDFELTDSTNISNCGLIGSREGSGEKRFYIISFYNNKWHLGLQGDITSSTYSVIRNQIQKVIFQSVDGYYSLTVDGTEIYSGKSVFSTTYPMYLFGVNNYGTASRLSSLKLYTLKIQQDGNYIRNFIPCYRKSDNEIGLYDLLSQTFYTNQGIGEFLKGEDVFSDSVYGGYVDLVSGELVETHSKYIYSGGQNLNTSPVNDNTRLFTSKGWIPYTLFKLNTSLLCNYSKYISELPSDEEAVPWTICQTRLGWIRIYVPSSIETVSDMDNYFIANPIQVVGELATPITHQLTPTQLQSFVGQNNFWSNADYVEVEYDLIETEDIQKCRKKIMLNQPHVESKKGSESSMEVTHFKTDMIAPLKECKVYFNPIQDGSGDPSSTNIRDFVGWTKAWIGHSGVNLLYCDSPDYYINKSGTNDGITSTLTRNTDGEIEAITFNGTTTNTNVFRNLNYTPSIPSEVTMPSGKIALTTYSSQVYIVPMGSSDIPRTINGKAWHQSYIDTLDNWTVWDVDSYENYNGLWIRAQVFPRQKDLSIDTTIYPMMCLMEDKGCEFEPYKGNDYSVDWADSVGNVYGGYVDFISGELVSEWGYIESYNGEAINTEWMSDRDVYIEGEVPTAGAKVIYKLSEPITYQLTPQQLITYKGVNNILSYTNGQAEVRYWTYKSIPQEEINYLNYVVWSEAGYIWENGKETIQATSASHFFKNPILLKAGTYNLNGFSNYVGSNSTKYRIHEYNQNGVWVKQITYEQIDNLSPVDISFTLDKDTYVKLSIAIAFEGTLTKVS